MQDKLDQQFPDPPKTRPKSDDINVPVGKKQFKKLVKRQVHATQEKIGCTACGAPIELKCEAMSEMVTCSYCGAVLDLESPDRKVLRKVVLQATKSATLPLGSKGKLKGVEWEVIGRVQMVVESIYYWDEFLLFSPTQGYAWLQLEEGHWTFMRKTKSKPTINPRYSAKKNKFKMYGKTFTVLEVGKAKIDYIEGEFPYHAEAGDIINYLDSVAPPLMICSEWNDQEIEWLSGEYIEPEIIKNAFKLKSVPRKTGVGACQPFVVSPFRKQLTKLLWVFAAIYLLLTIVTGVIGSGEIIDSFPITGSEYIIDANNPNDDVFASKPFELKSSKICCFQFSAPVNNSWIYLNVSVIDEEKQTVIDFAKNISYYHGSSGGESWSEGSQSANAYVKLEPGKYKMYVSGEGGQGETGTIPRGETVKVEVRQGIILQRYLLIMFFISLAFPLFETVRRGSFEKQRFGDDDDD